MNQSENHPYVVALNALRDIANNDSVDRASRLDACRQLLAFNWDAEMAPKYLAEEVSA